MAYAKATAVVVGTKLVADGGFTCIGVGDDLCVFHDAEAGDFYVECDEGRHYLGGQLEEGQYVGFFLADPEPFPRPVVTVDLTKGV